MMMPMMRSPSPTLAPVETISLQRTALPATLAGKALSPRSALAATYSTYVVRVHTRHGIKTISFDVLAAFFTYTAKKAAEDLGISSRTLIRVCRSLGIRRWPYLGFRSEKNVERIRQEAIENLRRKLEREGAAETTTASAHASASCLRGASAKRLLQVKPQHLPSMATLPKTPRIHHSPCDFQTMASPMPHVPPHCINTIVSPTAASTPPFRSAPAFGSYASMPMLTPPPTEQNFNLDRQPSLSPRHANPSQMHLHSAHSYGQEFYHSKGEAQSNMPSLNVLMEASILTAFRKEVETHMNRSAPSPQAALVDSHHARTMSMRDILSNTALAA